MKLSATGPLSKRLSVLLAVAIAAFGAMSMGSCVSMKTLTYMQGKFDTARLSQLNLKDPVIQKGDILSIIVYSDNPNATSLYNQSVVASSSSAGGGVGGSTGNESVLQVASGSPTTPGYLVDEGGNIQFQGLGRLHVEGLTKTALKDTLDSKLKAFLTNPYYTIRFQNYRFSILGEVNRPGIYSIPSEHISILEAMGLAGDMTFYGRRDNVLIIRQENDQRKFCRLDFTKPDIMGSPFFYLQQNDVVIVEATKRKAAANDQVTTRNITIGATLASTIAVIYSIFRK